METTDTIRVPTGDSYVEADVALPEPAYGLIVFAHGSGSSRRSPRNRRVAEALRERGLGTVLVDLLTAEEERVDLETHKPRFDIPLLAGRLVAVTDRFGRRDAGGPFGLFGASTGAAAALVAAAERPAMVRAVVSRGGRPDLAGEHLARVRAPTLLIVGGNDPQVADLNTEAQEQLTVETELAIVPDASHLFEEPGAMDQVIDLAGTWFLNHLATGSGDAAQPGGRRGDPPP